MKVWVVTRWECDGYEAEDQDVFAAVCASPLDALAWVERDAGFVDGKKSSSKSIRSYRLSLGKGSGGYGCDIDHADAVTLEAEYERLQWLKYPEGMRQVGTNETYWSHRQTWHIREVEVEGS